LFNSGLYHSGTKLIIDGEHSKSLAAAYSSPDWLWNGGIRQFFGMISPDMHTHTHICSILGRDDFISVLGLEKPRLRITEHGVYSYQDDDTFARVMPMPGVDCFFISPDLPELHVKQSYMMLNYIKSRCPGAASPKDVMHYENLHYTMDFPNWYEYSISASGRFGDLAHSDLQHQKNNNTRFVLPISGKFDGSEMTGRPARWFRDLYNTDKKTFDNFTNGYMAVMTDPHCKFLLQEKENVFNLKHFYSEYHCLTF
jgi:hypothetical protein